MPEVRCSLPKQLHRQLKEQAAHEGLYLKVLIAKILQEHVKNQKEHR